MNYRVLFITAFLILIVGIAGILFYMPSDTPQEEVAVSEPAPTTEEVVTEVSTDQNSSDKPLILVKINRDMVRGQILRRQDMTLYHPETGEQESFVTMDLSTLLGVTDESAVDNTQIMQTLRGFAVTKDLVAGDLLSPDILVSPEDEKAFIGATTDPKTEVAYSLCIRPEDGDSLITLQSGDEVALFAYNPDEPRKVKLAPLFNSIPLLWVKETVVENSEQESKSDNTACAFSVRLKLHLAQVQKMYAVKPDSRYLLLPAYSDLPAQHRGTLIRSLRGN